MTTIIHVEERKLVLDCGSTHDITDWVDEEGEPCEVSDAVFAIADVGDGTDAVFLVDLRSFRSVTPQ
jgi:hypothetical protein